MRGQGPMEARRRPRRSASALLVSREANYVDRPSCRAVYSQPMFSARPPSGRAGTPPAPARKIWSVAPLLGTASARGSWGPVVVFPSFVFRPWWTDMSVTSAWLRTRWLSNIDPPSSADRWRPQARLSRVPHESPAGGCRRRDQLPRGGPTINAVTANERVPSSLCRHAPAGPAARAERPEARGPKARPPSPRPRPCPRPRLRPRPSPCPRPRPRPRPRPAGVAGVSSLPVFLGLRAASPIGQPASIDRAWLVRPAWLATRDARRAMERTAARGPSSGSAEQSRAAEQKGQAGQAALPQRCAALRRTGKAAQSRAAPPPAVDERR